eukprot:gene360-3717_t
MSDQHHHVHLGTAAIHAGQEPEKWSSWAVCPPISLATTFKQPEPGVTKAGYEYSRGGNPTRNSLEEAFAAVCNGKHGRPIPFQEPNDRNKSKHLKTQRHRTNERTTLVWASGLAGTQAVLQLLRPNDHVLAIDDLYGGTNRLLRRLGEPMGIMTDFVSTVDPVKFAAAMKPTTKLVWFETPTNPLLQVTDIKAVVDLVKEKNKDCVVVVDNTFMSAYFQRPLDLGADIEFASVTKYYNGHSDVLMGVTILKNDELAERLRFIQFAAGAVPGPFDCYLVNRGLKTLHVRMERHAQNALRVAQYLEQHSMVRKVIYPGLPSHPGHEIAKRQCSGFSGMVTFRIKGDVNSSRIFLKALKVFTLAESLGAVESLAELPCIMTHASVPPEQRAQLGITDDLLRLSVGIEHIDDLLNDLDQALKAAAEENTSTGSSVEHRNAHVVTAAIDNTLDVKLPSKMESLHMHTKGPTLSSSRPASRRAPPGGYSSLTLG